MLTDDETTNSTSINLDTLDSNNVDVFSQLLNQNDLGQECPRTYERHVGITKKTSLQPKTGFLRFTHRLIMKYLS